MSEFDVINGKLDRLLAIATRGEVVPPETPVPMPHPEAPPPVPQPELPPSAFIPRAGPPPTQWALLRSLASLYAGSVYTISGPPGRGYMVSGGEGGADAIFNGDGIGSAMLIFDANGRATLTSNKTCEAWLDPI